MELSSRNLHKRLLEMCDCYLETDHRLVMAEMSGAKCSDLEEEALKFLSLAILHTVSEKGRKLSLKKKGAELTVTVKNDEKEALPVPPVAIMEEIFRIMRQILHQEEPKAEMPLELGLRNSQLEVMVRWKQKEGKESLAITFPPL